MSIPPKFDGPGVFDTTCKRLIISFKCPYCGWITDVESSAHSHLAMCHLASLVDNNFCYPDDEWRPPKPFNQFGEWSMGDRQEFCRRLDRFYSKYYQ
jgi:hypothetical protein